MLSRWPDEPTISREEAIAHAREVYRLLGNFAEPNLRKYLPSETEFLRMFLGQLDDESSEPKTAREMQLDRLARIAKDLQGLIGNIRQCSVAVDVEEMILLRRDCLFLFGKIWVAPDINDLSLTKEAFGILCEFSRIMRVTINDIATKLERKLKRKRKGKNG